MEASFENSKRELTSYWYNHILTKNWSECMMYYQKWVNLFIITSCNKYHIFQSGLHELLKDRLSESLSSHSPKHCIVCNPDAAHSSSDLENGEDFHRPGKVSFCPPCLFSPWWQLLTPPVISLFSVLLGSPFPLDRFRHVDSLFKTWSNGVMIFH